MLFNGHKKTVAQALDLDEISIELVFFVLFIYITFVYK